MLYHLEGTVTELSHDTLVLDCSGVGFEVTITPNTASSMKRGEKGKVYITESISENSFDLYGFLTWREKQFFKMLTSVSGVGPKAAMSILSYNTPDSLAISIVNENEKALTACPGIGKKTAQRIILELKDKFTKEIAAEGLPASSTVSVSPGRAGGAYDDALAALAMLGYSTADVAPVLRQISTENMTANRSYVQC